MVVALEKEMIMASTTQLMCRHTSLALLSVTQQEAMTDGVRTALGIEPVAMRSRGAPRRRGAFRHRRYGALDGNRGDFDPRLPERRPRSSLRFHNS